MCRTFVERLYKSFFGSTFLYAVGACTFRTVISHHRPLTTIYNFLSLKSSIFVIIPLRAEYSVGKRSFLFLFPQKISNPMLSHVTIFEIQTFIFCVQTDFEIPSTVLVELQIASFVCCLCISYLVLSSCNNLNIRCKFHYDYTFHLILSKSSLLLEYKRRITVMQELFIIRFNVF